MMHKHTKPIGQRKVSPPGPSYMNNDQMGKLSWDCGLTELSSVTAHLS
jgi:hypothetical protein